MKKTKKLALTLKKLIPIIILNIYQISVYSQCAMCKAGAEQSLERGSTAVNWINYAIIFLMTVPLVLIFSLYMLYRYNRKKNDL
jgi:heme/copper-type cytochrome/quinol oxidase subunit 2